MSGKKIEERRIYPCIEEESFVLLHGVAALVFVAISLSIMLI